MTNTRKKIILTGGGSGGHVMPLLALWDKLNNQLDFLYIGENNGKEKSIVERKGIKFRGILTGKLRRYFSLLNIVDFFKVPLGIIQSMWHIFWYKPDLILAKGGYVSLPVGIAGWMMRVPLIIHESDAVMGLSNRILTKLATRIVVAYPLGRYDQKYVSKMVWGGMPVRNWNCIDMSRRELVGFFNFKDELPVVLVTGGGQGAVNVNRYVIKNIDKILEFCNVIHLTGSYDYEHVKQVRDSIKENASRYRVFDFLYEDYDKAMCLADIVVCRAGSTTLAEISNLAKPSILIPLPTAASNHQYYNAKSFEDVGASVVIEEREFDRVSLSILLEAILEDEEKMFEMKSASVTAMKTEGSVDILGDLVLDLLKK